MATIDNLSIQVTASAESAASAFDRLASSAGGLRGAAAKAGGGLRDLTAGAKYAGTATQEAGTQSGEAARKIGKFWDALRGVGSRISGSFVQAIHRGTAAVGTFLKSIARIAFYRAIRSIIKDLGQSFKDLYGYSRMFGTDFAKSMDRITTASVYLRNSFAAMVAPLVNLFAPALDMLADKIVDILNFVNQLFASINGQETYTVAKKVATTWESTFDSTANHAKKKIKEVRNTLLGFDEINRLNGATPSTSGSTGSSPYTPGYSTMFEEKPLEGYFKKISDITSGMPDWLKWLLGGTTLVGGFLLIKKFIPWLLGKIGELFAFKIPDWIKWLFGPKNNNDIGLDIPDSIDLPDADVDVNLKQGDWSVLQEIPSEKYLLLKVGVKMDGWLGNGNPQLPSNQSLVIENDDSDIWDFTIQKASVGANSLQAINNQLGNIVDNWDDLAWEVAKMEDNIIINRTLQVSVKRSDKWDGIAWDATKLDDGNVTRTIIAVVNQGDWDKTAWLAANMTSYSATRKITSVVKKGQGAQWNKDAWTAANMTSYSPTRKITVVVQKGSWNDAAWTGANMTSYSPTRKITVVVQKGSWNNDAWIGANMTPYSPMRKITVVVQRGAWNNDAWTGANMTPYSPTRTITVVVQKGLWNREAWEAAHMTPYSPTRTITAVVQKGSWNGEAWEAAHMTPYSPTRTITAVVQKGSWNGEAWEAAHMMSYSPTRTITAVVKKGEWDSEAWKAVNINSGSKTVSVGVKLTEDNTNTTGFNLWDWWKNTFVKNTKFEIDTLVNLVQNGWTSVEGYVDNNFGGGNGGGGQTAGGGGGRYDVNIGLRRYDGWGDDSWTTVSGWVSQFSGDAIVEQVVGLVSSGWNYVVDWVNGRVGGNATTGVDLTNKGTNWSKGIVNFITGGLGYVSLAIKFATTTGNVVTAIAGALKKALGITTASGGVFSNGVWSSIPQYAGGTTNAHGSLFLAGEAGPEIVGHVGGRTEVLNKSQLAAAMYSAVHSAMAGVTLDADFRGDGAGYTDEGEYETMYKVMYEAFTAALARGEAMVAAEVDLLRQINEKDFTAEVSTAEINNAQRRMNRRAGTTIVPVS